MKKFFILKIKGQISAWSFSRWWDYESCPYKAGLKHVMRMKEPGNEAMDRGSDIHKLGEDYLNKKLPRPPSVYNQFKPALLELRKQKAQPELQWALTTDMKKADWFSPKAWLRVKLDALALNAKGTIARMIDFKSGRAKDHHPLQLSLYAWTGFVLMPKVRKVISELWYLDQPGKPTVETYTRETDLVSIEKDWRRRIKPMLNDKVFEPKPGNHCKWCYFRKSNGGPCIHS
jgi:hypothetical protein